MLVLFKTLSALNNDVVLRLQVDDSEEPLKELRRVVEKWNATQRRRR